MTDERDPPEVKGPNSDASSSTPENDSAAKDKGKDADNVVRVDFGKKREGTQTRREIPIPKATDLPEDPTAPQKLEAFTKLIEMGMTMVTVDSRRPGVVVPPVHQGEIQLNLNFSLRFGIDDFRYDEDDVRASLSFGGIPHLCILPWSAVYMVRSHVTDDVAVFPNSLPPELQAAAAAELERLQEEVEEPDESAGPVELTAVAGEAEQEVDEESGPAAGDEAADPQAGTLGDDKTESEVSPDAATQRRTPQERPKMGLRLVTSDDES